MIKCGRNLPRLFLPCVFILLAFINCFRIAFTFFTILKIMFTNCLYYYLEVALQIQAWFKRKFSKYFKNWVWSWHYFHGWISKISKYKNDIYQNPNKIVICINAERRRMPKGKLPAQFSLDRLWKADAVV